MSGRYVHGYSDIENTRLYDQANTLSDLLHHDTLFPKGSKVLEIGCGVGAQTIIICSKNPEIELTSIDISKESIQIAEKRCREAGFTNVNFVHADLHRLPFQKENFDFVFICFVLEHLPNPGIALQKIKEVIKPGGTLVTIEGDHGSAYYYPQSGYAQKTIECLIQLQSQTGADSLIGRRLYPLLKSSGYVNIKVSPRMVYADATKPEMVDGFTFKTFIAMVEGVEEMAINNALIERNEWERGITDLRKTGEKDGVFCYTFFKATARK